MASLTPQLCRVVPCLLLLLGLSLTLCSAIIDSQRTPFVDLLVARGVPFAKANSSSCYSLRSGGPLDYNYAITGACSMGFITDLTFGRCDGFITIPPSISALRRLTSLNFGGCLNGTLPSPILALRNLQKLTLHSNHMTGQIPTLLASLTALSFLDLGYNRLTGMIPNHLSKLTNLAYLDLSYNFLGGHFPPFIQQGSLTKLTSLFVEYNYFSGRLLGSCTQGYHEFDTNCLAPSNCTSNYPPNDAPSNPYSQRSLAACKSFCGANLNGQLPCGGVGVCVPDQDYPSTFLGTYDVTFSCTMM